MIDTDALYLTHYCHPNCEPLKNIMRLPRADAFAAACELARLNENTTAFYRFADFENYYPRRMEADALLRARFAALGFAPAQAHPLSFVLTESDYLKKWFGGGAETRVPLDGIPENCVSFTYGDSMGVLKRNEPLRLVSKSALLADMAAFGGTLDEYMRGIARECYYIEAQVWDDDCVFKLLEEAVDHPV